MKKIFLVLCVVALSFGAISCQKECVCTIKTSQGTYTEAFKVDKQECKNAMKDNDKDFKCVWR